MKSYFCLSLQLLLLPLLIFQHVRGGPLFAENQKPNITNPEKSYNYNIGDQIEIKCSASGTNPISIGWTKLYGGQSPNFHITQPARSLVIPKARISDAGQYKCTASNAHGTNTAIFTININPKIITKPENKTVYTGSTVYFHCLFISESAPAVYWNVFFSRDSQVSSAALPNINPLWPNKGQLGKYVVVVDPDHSTITGQSGSTIVVRNVQPRDASRYSCSALGHGSTEISSEASLRVIPRDTSGMPPILEHVNLTRVVLLAGTHASLLCTVLPTSAFASGTTAELLWSKENRTLGATDPTMRAFPNGTLLFFSVRASHAGNYSCIAQNSRGATKWSIQVSVTEEPRAATVTVPPLPYKPDDLDYIILSEPTLERDPLDPTAAFLSWNITLPFQPPLAPYSSLFHTGSGTPFHEFPDVPINYLLEHWSPSWVSSTGPWVHDLPASLQAMPAGWLPLEMSFIRSRNIWHLSGLRPGNTYYFVVRARTSLGYGPPSPISQSFEVPFDILHEDTAFLGTPPLPATLTSFAIPFVPEETKPDILSALSISEDFLSTSISPEGSKSSFNWVFYAALIGSFGAILWLLLIVFCICAYRHNRLRFCTSKSKLAKSEVDRTAMHPLLATFSQSTPATLSTSQLTTTALAVPSTVFSIGGTNIPLAILRSDPSQPMQMLLDQNANPTSPTAVPCSGGTSSASSSLGILLQRSRDSIHVAPDALGHYGSGPVGQFGTGCPMMPFQMPVNVLLTPRQTRHAQQQGLFQEGSQGTDLQNSRRQTLLFSSFQNQQPTLTASIVYDLQAQNMSPNAVNPQSIGQAQQQMRAQSFRNYSDAQGRQTQPATLPPIIPVPMPGPMGQMTMPSPGMLYQNNGSLTLASMHMELKPPQLAPLAETGNSDYASANMFVETGSMPASDCLKSPPMLEEGQAKPQSHMFRPIPMYASEINRVQSSDSQTPTNNDYMIVDELEIGQGQPQQIGQGLMGQGQGQIRQSAPLQRKRETIAADSDQSRAATSKTKRRKKRRTSRANPNGTPEAQMHLSEFLPPPPETPASMVGDPSNTESLREDTRRPDGERDLDGQDTLSDVASCLSAAVSTRFSDTASFVAGPSTRPLSYIGEPVSPTMSGNWPTEYHAQTVGRLEQSPRRTLLAQFGTKPQQSLLLQVANRAHIGPGPALLNRSKYGSGQPDLVEALSTKPRQSEAILEYTESTTSEGQPRSLCLSMESPLPEESSHNENPDSIAISETSTSSGSELDGEGQDYGGYECDGTEPLSSTGTYNNRNNNGHLDVHEAITQHTSAYDSGTSPQNPFNIMSNNNESPNGQTTLPDPLKQSQTQDSIANHRLVSISSLGSSDSANSNSIDFCRIMRESNAFVSQLERSPSLARNDVGMVENVQNSRQSSGSGSGSTQNLNANLKSFAGPGPVSALSQSSSAPLKESDNLSTSAIVKASNSSGKSSTESQPSTLATSAQPHGPSISRPTPPRRDNLHMPRIMEPKPIFDKTRLAQMRGSSIRTEGQRFMNKTEDSFQNA